jgi:hypothetical protein
MAEIGRRGGEASGQNRSRTSTSQGQDNGSLQSQGDNLNRGINSAAEENL